MMGSSYSYLLCLKEVKYCKEYVRKVKSCRNCSRYQTNGCNLLIRSKVNQNDLLHYWGRMRRS